MNTNTFAAPETLPANERPAAPETTTVKLSSADCHAIAKILNTGGRVYLTQGKAAANRLQKVHCQRLIDRGLVVVEVLDGERATEPRGFNVRGMIGRAWADARVTALGCRSFDKQTDHGLNMPAK